MEPDWSKLTVTEQQMLDATEYVRAYRELIGENPYDIDWDRKPKNLPEDVSAAWDTHNLYGEQLREIGVII